MKRALRGMALMLALVLICAPAAVAEMQRGSTGDMVYYLQELLFECGWLFELPDGVFGKNTEQAVRDYEAFVGLPADGIADDEMLSLLEDDWYALMVELGQIEPYDSDGSEGLAADGRYPAFCHHSNGYDGYSAVDYCEIHANLCEQADALLMSGTEEDAQEAYNLWRAEIIRLYEAWLERSGDDEKANIVASRSLFLSAMEAQLRAVRQYYGTFQIDPGRAQAFRAMEIPMREHAAWLCALTSGSLAVNESGLEQ